jgi:hypothetical protein
MYKFIAHIRLSVPSNFEGSSYDLKIPCPRLLHSVDRKLKILAA